VEINLTRDKGEERQKPNKRNQNNQISFSGFVARHSQLPFVVVVVVVVFSLLKLKKVVRNILEQYIYSS